MVGRGTLIYGVPYTTVHAGKISGGDTLNIVADRASVDFEIRYLDEDNVDDILSRIRSAADVDTEIEVRNAYLGLATSADSPAVKYAKDLLGITSMTKVPDSTDFNQAHSEQEQVRF